MTATHVLQANFTQLLGKGLPTIPGVRGLYFFGSGYDGFNGNRISGGTATSTFGTVSYATNYVAAVGYNGTTASGINTNIARDAAMLASGWTWCCVARANTGGSIGGVMMEDSGGTGPPLQATLCGMAFQSSANFNSYQHAGGTAIRATLVLPRTTAGNWHFYATTYTGGALGTHTFSEFTDTTTGTTPMTYVETVALSATGNCPVFGNNVPNGPSNYTVLADVAFGMVAAGVMIQSDIAALAAAVRPWLVRRGVAA